MFKVNIDEERVSGLGLGLGLRLGLGLGLGFYRFIR